MPKRYSAGSTKGTQYELSAANWQAQNVDELLYEWWFNYHDDECDPEDLGSSTRQKPPPPDTSQPLVRKCLLNPSIDFKLTNLDSPVNLRFGLPVREFLTVVWAVTLAPSVQSRAILVIKREARPRLLERPWLTACNRWYTSVGISCAECYAKPAKYHECDLCESSYSWHSQIHRWER